MIAAKAAVIEYERLQIANQWLLKGCGTASSPSGCHSNQAGSSQWRQLTGTLRFFPV